MWDIHLKFPPVFIFHFLSIPPNAQRTNSPRTEQNVFISGKITAHQGQYKQKCHNLVLHKASLCMCICMSQILKNFLSHHRVLQWLVAKEKQFANHEYLQQRL